MSDVYLVNGNVHSWASIITKAYDEVWTGFTSVSFGDKRERSLVYGQGRHHAPRGRSHGKYTPEPIKLGGPKASVQQFIAGLAAKAPDSVSFGDVEFQIVVQFVEAEEGSITVVAERCVVTSLMSTHDESPDALKDEIEIQTLWLRRNNLTLFDSRQGGL